MEELEGAGLLSFSDPIKPLNKLGLRFANFERAFLGTFANPCKKILITSECISAFKIGAVLGETFSSFHLLILLSCSD